MCNTRNSNKQCNNNYSEQCHTISKYYINNNNDLFGRQRNLYGNTCQWWNNSNLCMADKWYNR